MRLDLPHRHERGPGAICTSRAFVLLHPFCRAVLWVHSRLRAATLAQRIRRHPAPTPQTSTPVGRVHSLASLSPSRTSIVGPQLAVRAGHLERNACGAARPRLLRRRRLAASRRAALGAARRLRLLRRALRGLPRGSERPAAVVPRRRRRRLPRVGARALQPVALQCPIMPPLAGARGTAAGRPRACAIRRTAKASSQRAGLGCYSAHRAYGAASTCNLGDVVQAVGAPIRAAFCLLPAAC